MLVYNFLYKSKILLYYKNMNESNNKYENLIEKINQLPYELVNEIKYFLPSYKLIFTNKENYSKYHHLVYNLIQKRVTSNYIRDIIYRDNEFVFKHLLYDKYQTWVKYTKYIYHNIIYSNYIEFIRDLCITNQSTKCANILNEFLKENGFTENPHKKNIVKHIRWRT